MPEVSIVRLYVLRATYLLIVVGVGFMIWPRLLDAPESAEHFRGVTWTLLGTVALLAVVGLRHPLKMLPLLFFELVWKTIWIVTIGLPLRSAGALEGAFAETWFANVIGLAIFSLAIPWGYVIRHYVRAPGDRWRWSRSAIQPVILAVVIVMGLGAAGTVSPRDVALSPARQPEPALSGRVVLPDSITRAAGIVIEAVMESDPSVRVRALSNPAGDFTLRLGRAGAWRVAAMRIGYTPTTLGRFVLDAGEHRRLATPTVLSGVAVRFTLARLEIHEADICGRSTDEAGLLVATLLAQARAALASTVLTQAAGGARAEWQTFAIFTDRTGTPISPMRLTPHAAATERPFAAAPIEALMSRGYYWESQQQVQFHAPDAHVLLSEPFVGSHCYRVSAPHAERPEWIGVAFAPAEQRLGIVEVYGTLWLDRESAELRRLDFGYVDLPDEIEAAKPRGQVDFLRLPTDVWVVSRWELRLPRTDAVLSGTGNVRAAPARQLNVMKISGGELMTVHRGRRELFRNQVHPVERFPALSDRVGMPPVCLDAPERRPGESGVLFGSIVDTLGNPVNATVRILWSDIGRRRSVNADQELFVSANDGVYIACGLTLGARLRVTGYVGSDRIGEETLVLLRAPRTWASVDLTIP